MGNSVWQHVGAHQCWCSLQTTGIFLNWCGSKNNVSVTGTLNLVGNHFSPTGATAFSFAFFRQGIGSIWLDNVVCIGNETRVYDCQNTGIAVHNCSHLEDVGVRCQIECKQQFDTTWLCLIKVCVYSLIQISQCISSSLSRRWYPTWWRTKLYWRPSWNLFQQPVGHSLS